MRWIVDEVNRLATDKKYLSGDRRVKPLNALVYHYTAGTDRPMRPRVETWLKSPRAVSTHFMISRCPSKDPTLQLAALEERTWHAGGAKWHGLTGINFMSIGIDLDNLGFLSKKSGMWRDSYENRYKGPTPFIDEKGVGWEPYTDESITEACRVTDLICQNYPLFRLRADHLIGHEDIVPTKRDPGPAFPWDLIRSAARIGV